MTGGRFGSSVREEGECKRKSIATTVLVLLALAGQISAQESSPTDEKAISGHLDEWIAAYNAEPSTRPGGGGSQHTARR
jgi:hypothetical protein